MKSLFAEFLVDPSGKCSDPERFNLLGRIFGLEEPSVQHFGEIAALARTGIPGATATPDSLSLVQGLTRCGVQVVREEGRIVGMIGFIPLRESGLKACQDGAFDPSDLLPAQVARPHETPATIYAWGFVGTTDRARRIVVKYAVAVGQTLTWNCSAYARPVSADGHRVVVGKMGYRPVSGSASLYFHEPLGSPLPETALEIAA